MDDNSYEAYKRGFHSKQRKHNNLYMGLGMLVTGVCLLLYFLYIFPFHVSNANEIRGEEMQAGNAYGRIQVYYIDQLQLLYAKTDTDDGKIYSIAKFTDCDQNEWIISFTPGKDKELEKRISDGIKFSSSLDKSMDLTINGYFQMQNMNLLPYEAYSFYSVYSDKYANVDKSNILSLNADYLCKRTSNYMLALFFRPSMLFGSFVIGLAGIVYGSVLLIQSRSRKTL